MKKVICFCFAAMILTNICFAQAYEGTVKYKKIQQPAIVMVYNYPAEIVENALKAKLADKRLKGSTSKGFIRYNNSVISEISKTPLDYSFRIEESGRRDKKIATVYMVMEGSNAITNDAASYAANGKLFLNQLTPNVEQSNYITQIKKQEELMVKEEKKLKELKDDNESLQKKIKENERQQATQQKVIASQNSILRDLKSKLK